MEGPSYLGVGVSRVLLRSNQRANIKKCRVNRYDKETEHRTKNKLNQKQKQYNDQIHSTIFEISLNFRTKRAVMGS